MTIANVLLVDDEVPFVETMTKRLSKRNLGITAAFSGMEALERLSKESTTEVVILDVKMPGMHGIEVLERIRETGSDVPIILSTAYQQMESNAAVSTARVACFLSKPIDIARLRAEVRRVLEEKEAGASPQVQNRSSTL